MKIHQWEIWLPASAVCLVPAFFFPMKKLLTLLFSLAIASVVLAADPSLTGAWKVDSDTAGNLNSATITLKQDGNKVTGTMKGAEGNEVALKGEFDGKKVTWSYEAEWSGNKLTIVHTGTLNADGSMSGSIEVQPMGVEGSFTAKRVEAQK